MDCIGTVSTLLVEMIKMFNKTKLLKIKEQMVMVGNDDVLVAEEKKFRNERRIGFDVESLLMARMHTFTTDTLR